MDEIDGEPAEEPTQTNWKTCFSENIRASEIIFIAQIIVVYIVVIACIINLSLKTEHHDLWVTLLGTSLGYILPAPSITKT